MGFKPPVLRSHSCDPFPSVSRVQSPVGGEGGQTFPTVPRACGWGWQGRAGPLGLKSQDRVRSGIRGNDATAAKPGGVRLSAHPGASAGRPLESYPTSLSLARLKAKWQSQFSFVNGSEG